jgi:hypothetical protein
MPMDGRAIGHRTLDLALGKRRVCILKAKVVKVTGDFRYIGGLWNRHRHGERHDIFIYWSWHAYKIEKTIIASLACTITYERLRKELNHEVGTMCVRFQYFEKLGEYL